MIEEDVAAMVSSTTRMREAIKGFIIPKEGTDEAKDTGRMANAYYAVEVAVSVCNIFTALGSPNVNATFTLVTDLTINLNTNPFWVRNTGHLMPLIIAGVNASMDYREMSIEPEPKWDALREQCKWLWLDIFPTIMFLVHGFALTRLCSVQMKKTIAGLVNG